MFILLHFLNSYFSVRQRLLSRTLSSLRRAHPAGTADPARPARSVAIQRIGLVLGVCMAVGASGLPFLATLGAQTPTRLAQDRLPTDSVGAHLLSLGDAVNLAQQRSDAVRMANNAVRRARGTQYQARSTFLPQIAASGNYTRTLRSQYQGIFGPSPADTTSQSASPAPPCEQYILGPSATDAQRVAGLESYARCSSANSFGFNFSSLPFGQANAYTVGLSASQNLFTGGRATGQLQSANASRRSAEIELTAQQAQATLDVTQAYYDAALSDRLLEISKSALAQTEQTLQQTQLRQQVGNTSEFELLRATVARDNQRPVVLQQQTNRDVAYLRLKQLLNLPLSEPLRLTTAIEDTTAAPPGLSLSAALNPDTVTEHRATVREAAENVTAQQGQFKVARSQRYPTLQLSSSYGSVAYPTGGLPSMPDFHANWTVTLATSFPIFTGGKIRGDELVAEANLRDARDQLHQMRQLAALDAQIALSTLRQAEAALAASQGTAEQAQRAYDIAEVRYREGLSTQLELTDSRNLLDQALVNRAQAARDALVARVKLALLPDLPVQQQGAGQTSLSSQQQQQQQQQQAQQQAQQQQQQQQAAAQGGTNPAAMGPGTGF